MLPNVVRRRTNSLPNFVDEFFNDGFLTGFFTPDYNWRNNGTPAVNVEETEKDYRIEVAAPGLEKNDIKVSVNEGVLSVAYEKKTEKEEKKDSYLRREFGYTSFNRSFALPEETDVDKIIAQHKNGVLHITVPKAEAKVVPSREIKIS